MQDLRCKSISCTSTHDFDYIYQVALWPKKIQGNISLNKICVTNQPANRPMVSNTHPVLHLRGEYIISDRTREYIISDRTNQQQEHEKKKRFEYKDTHYKLVSETPWLWLCQQGSEGKGHDLKLVNIDGISKYFIKVVWKWNLVPNRSYKGG